MSSSNRLLILDFGSQYTQLIARRIRELGVYCEIYAFDIDSEKIRSFDPAGIILSGGPETVTLEHTPRAPQIIFELKCPLLGICYGMQTLAEQLGGSVSAHAFREFGYTEVELINPSLLIKNVIVELDSEGKSIIKVWMSHGDQVENLPPGFFPILSSANTPYAGMANEEKHYYGVQFHPEVTHTPQGKHLLESFVYTICCCSPCWNPRNIMESTLIDIREKVGEDQVILGLSGGVDSTVLAALISKAIGKQLICVFVDTGLLRHDDVAHMKVLQHYLPDIEIIHIDASKRFLEALNNVQDPEQKRKIIGRLFIETFEKIAYQYTNVAYLAQGTIYSDVIESADSSTKKAHAIKSHHNVGGLPAKMNFKLLEPLRDLFKDEVFQLGTELGLPRELIYKHPFPGPGLAIRIIGEITQERLALLRQADSIFIHELKKNDLYRQVNQAFAVFLPINSVGVIGDARQYAPVIGLRAVTSTDFMTATWAHLPYSFLEQVSNRIINEIKGISRVVYDISSKPPATIEWE